MADIPEIGTPSEGRFPSPDTVNRRAVRILLECIPCYVLIGKIYAIYRGASSSGIDVPLPPPKNLDPHLKESQVFKNLHYYRSNSFAESSCRSSLSTKRTIDPL